MKRRNKCALAAMLMVSLLALTACQSAPKENPAVTVTFSADSDQATSQKEESSASSAVVQKDQFPAGTTEGTELGYQLELPEEGEEIAVMTTSMGTISIRLFPEAAPKTVYNFKKLALQGYYDGLTFHRVIEDFMIQGGDPKGDGTGGESVWGESFEDEFNTNLVNLRGSLAMANSGSNTNGSQFFINQAGPVQSELWQSMAANYGQIKEQLKSMSKEDQQAFQLYYGYTFLNTDMLTDTYKKLYEENGGNPMLDGAYNAFDPQRGHAVFGQVFEGMDIVDKIAAVDTDDNDKPKEDVTIEKLEIVRYKKS